MPPDAREVIARRMKAYVEPDEVAGMERETTNLRDRLLIRLLFHSGCRISEALALAVEDVDFRPWHNHHSASENPSETVLYRVRAKAW